MKQIFGICILFFFFLQTTLSQDKDTSSVEVIFTPLPVPKGKLDIFSARNERVPLIVTLPDGKKVWLGGPHDRSAYTFGEDLFANELPFLKVYIKDSLKIRFQYCDLSSNAVSDWESNVFFDTTITFYKDAFAKKVMLIRKTASHYNYRRSKSNLHHLNISKVKSNSGRSYEVSIQPFTRSKDRLFWLFRKEPNAIWDVLNSKSVINEKYLPQELKSDERFHYQQ